MPTICFSLRHGKCRQVMWLIVALGLCGLVTRNLLPAADARSAPAGALLAIGAPVTPSPLEDDATLRDIEWIGATGVAVGDRGVIWQTTDGGETWEFLRSGFDALLADVFLLNGRIGCAVGALPPDGTGVSSGIVLLTSDGGLTWKRLDDGTLPPLTGVHLFESGRGYVVGEATVDVPTGVMLTEDGGKTWAPVPGPRTSGWEACSFTGDKNGVVVGARGQQGVIGNGRLLPPQTPTVLRGIHSVRLGAGGRGWMAGDGGFVRVTESSGVVWADPAGRLPPELRDLQDFHAVAARGSQVWLAGSPGSVIWHSSDAGQTWDRQSTGDPASICAVSFASDQIGCAVGSFGRISLTDDGGKTWRNVRAGGRRPAILTVHADPADVPTRLLARESGENGFRSVVALAVRPDAASDATGKSIVGPRFRSPVLLLGGNDAVVDWRLPVNVPDADRDQEALIREWSRITDQRLPEVLVGNLVAWMRTWRPEVVVLPGTEHGEVSRLLSQAVSSAIEQAADPARFPEQLELLGLAAWEVRKVFGPVAAAREGTLALNLDQVLPRLRTTVEGAAYEASRLLHVAPTRTRMESFELVRVAPGLAKGSATGNPSVLARGLFAGLTLPEGGDVRRRLPPLTDVNEEQLLQLARHRRNFLGYAGQVLGDPTRSGHLLAQLRETTAPLPPAEAARLLADLADDYRRRGQLEYAADVMIQLVEQYPLEPAAQPAMQWLLAYLVSQEVAWNELRQSATSEQTALNTSHADRTATGAVLQANFEQAARAANSAGNAAELQMLIGELPAPTAPPSRPGSPRVGNLDAVLQAGHQSIDGGGVPVGAGQRASDVSRRWQQARRLADVIQQVDPPLYHRPEIQFVLASLLRQQQQPTAANEIYRRFFGLEEVNEPWHMTGRSELWTVTRSELSPKPVMRCARCGTPPVLDGVLSDPCWASALEAPLTESPGAASGSVEATFVGSRQFSARSATPGSSGPKGIVMLAYDQNYLYLAASMPRAAEVRGDQPSLPGRAHDADLATFDRLSFCFDIDRDYATFYRFDVDQRGHTRESLWEDQTWDPQWFVAADGDGGYWRIEAAIPLESLTPTAPQRGTVWAAGVTRTIPSRGLQSWTHPASATPRPETFGMVQFD